VRRVGGDWEKAKSGENEGGMEVKCAGTLEFQRGRKKGWEFERENFS
jgi:hypothetical protein